MQHGFTQIALQLDIAVNIVAVLGPKADPLMVIERGGGTTSDCEDIKVKCVTSWFSGLLEILVSRETGG